MSPDENKKLDEISKNIKDIKKCQEDILDRVDRAEKVTDTTLEIASSVKGKFITIIGWIVVIGVISSLTWLAQKIGLIKLIELIK